MDLVEYFGKKKGFGILATADGDGKVDAAVYARPHVMEDGTIAMIMRDRLTHHNLQTNSHAAYLFHEDGTFFAPFDCGRFKNAELPKTIFDAS